MDHSFQTEYSHIELLFPISLSPSSGARHRHVQTHELLGRHEDNGGDQEGDQSWSPSAGQLLRPHPGTNMLNIPTCQSKTNRCARHQQSIISSSRNLTVNCLIVRSQRELVFKCCPLLSKQRLLHPDKTEFFFSMQSCMYYGRLFIKNRDFTN